MGYRLQQEESLSDGVRRIAREQIDKAIADLNTCQPHDAVHQLRKRCKKLRGLLRLVRPALDETYQRENRWYRELAADLSEVRDAEVMLKTWKTIQERHNSRLRDGLIERLQEGLEERRRRVADDQRQSDEAMKRRIATLQSARERVEDWQLEDEGFAAIRGGLKKTYRRGLRAFAKAKKQPTNDRLHEWRKRVKYHGYHLRLLRNAWPPIVDARIDQLGLLADALGDDHDLAVFRTTLIDDPAQFGSPEGIECILGLMQSQRDELQTSAYRLGEFLFAEQPAALIRRFETYWNVWRDS